MITGVVQLRPTAHRVVAGDQVLFSHDGRRVRVGPLDDALSWLLRRLAAGVDTGDLRADAAQRFPGDAARLLADVDRLAVAGIVRAAPRAPSPDVAAARFSRTAVYLSQFAEGATTEYDLLARLRRATVVLVGVGGLGSWIAYGLAGLGIGTLRLVDFDVVEASNLNRSILFDEADVGDVKVAAAARRLSAVSASTAITTRSVDLAACGLPRDLVDGADVVVSTADQPTWVVRRAVAEACVPRGVAFVCPAGLRVGPFHTGPGTACAMCELAALVERLPRAAAALARSSAIPASQPGSVPHVAAAGTAVVLQDVLRHLVGIEPPATRNRIWSVGPDLESSFADLPPHPRCVVCAGAGGPPVRA